MTALIVIAVLAAWFVCGGLGYLLTRHWWTAEFPWTTREHGLALFFALLGPINVLAGLLLEVSRVAESRPARELKPRRDAR